MAKEKDFDVRGHELVHKHEVLSDEEAEKLLEKYSVEAPQLPKIKSKDPVAKAMELEPGDIVKITRESRTAGKNVAYRFVV